MRLSTCQRLLLAVLCFLAVGTFSACQSQKRVITVGVINYRSFTEPTLDGFKAGMTDLGYVEHVDIKYIYPGPVEKIEELAGIADGFVEDKVDLILAIVSVSALAAKEATDGTDIPVVFAPVTDPLGIGLVERLDQPGGNITGVTTGSEARRLEWLVEVAHDIKRVYVPYNPDDPSASAGLGVAQTAAAELEIELVPYAARDDAAMVAAANEIPLDVDALFILPDNVAIAHNDEFVAAALARDLPFSSPTTEQVEKGALVSFGVNLFEVGRQAARLADQILQGQSPAELPVEQAEFFLTINLKTAEAIGLAIPDEILSQASRLIRE
jgi:putative ABC transport system substrate-binding protein